MSMGGSVKSCLIGWTAQWRIPCSLEGANMVAPGKKEQEGPTGPLSHCLASPLPNTWMTVTCVPSALVSQASVTNF